MVEQRAEFLLIKWMDRYNRLSKAHRLNAVVIMSLCDGEPALEVWEGKECLIISAPLFITLYRISRTFSIRSYVKRGN
jgi:hypothetical protein